jgi:hypothetical protein
MLMKSLSLVLAGCLLVTVPSVLSFTTFDTSIYDNSVVLDSTYTLYWLMNRNTTTIRIGVQAQTTGWVGFGISPNGGMIGMCDLASLAAPYFLLISPFDIMCQTCRCRCSNNMGG